ncbi:hypothetical protein [Cryptosporangium aurantiacum]|uniref:Uncharacterized protein n=1 Tax=Cryptosporangium aurantiacum TaxID=134849 RepID=A0A1M7R8P7_9ACTN|nr:hypothetical protein [Cryptosporangium aurantiacum]SHN42552.1 hypothetical protein SAMN05443668_108247 [Cryptosporangium aurantiacum]
MAKHRAICPSLVTVASLLTLVLGAAVMAEVVIAAVPGALFWQLGVGWVACSVALGLREGRRWALYAAATLAVISPGLAIVAADEVAAVAAVPFLLAPTALALLVPERSARWLRRRRPVAATVGAPVGAPAGAPTRTSAALAVQSDYALVGVAPGGRVSG